MVGIPGHGPPLHRMGSDSWWMLPGQRKMEYWMHESEHHIIRGQRGELALNWWLRRHRWNEPCVCLESLMESLLAYSTGILLLLSPWTPIWRRDPIRKRLFPVVKTSTAHKPPAYGSIRYHYHPTRRLLKARAPCRPPLPPAPTPFMVQQQLTFPLISVTLSMLNIRGFWKRVSLQAYKNKEKTRLCCSTDAVVSWPLTHGCFCLT
jgi:hypothetical protein